MRARQRNAIGGDQFESGQAIAKRRAHRAQQLDCGSDVDHRNPRRHRSARTGKQLQHGSRDDAERAFAAEEQLLEVVTGIVLAQTFQAVPNAAICEHDFEAEHEVARIAVTQDRGAARIGRQVATDEAASFCRE